MSGILPFLATALGLGIFHALDADHVAAVSNLTGTPSKPKKLWLLCSHWALGHGLTLLLVGTAVLLLGLAVPHQLSQFAEKLVGYILVILGILALWDISSNSFRKHFLPEKPIERLNPKKDTPSFLVFENDKSSPKALLIGMVHGLAGSTPLLVLIPIANQNSAWEGLGYLVVFSVGVLFSMVLFGWMLGIVLTWFDTRLLSFAMGFRTLIAFWAIGLGGYWIYDQV